MFERYDILAHESLSETRRDKEGSDIELVQGDPILFPSSAPSPEFLNHYFCYSINGD